MKFLQYINESTLTEETPIEEINETIKKDCRYYINLIKNQYIFKRGMKNHFNLLGKKQVRQDRRPKGMNSDTFKKLNKWLQDNNHVRRDKAVITANGLFQNMFGPLYYIFPIGKFNYTWLKARDINMKDISSGWYEYAVDNFFIHGEKTFDGDYKISLNKPFKEYFTTNKDIEKAWKERYEIWFDCKEYYYFDYESFEWLDGSGELSWR